MLLAPVGAAAEVGVEQVQEPTTKLPVQEAEAEAEAGLP